MGTKAGRSISQADGPREESFWVCVLLGVVLIAAGIFVLGDVAVAAVVSTVAIASAAILGGAFEIAHSFWTKGWGALGWRILLGALYIAFGTALISQPEFGAVVLAYVLGFILLASGIVRIFLSVRYGRLAGSLLLLSGAIGVVAGVVLLVRWPISGEGIIGLALGIDLVLHGAAWLTVAWQVAGAPPDTAGGGTTGGAEASLAEERGP